MSQYVVAIGLVVRRGQRTWKFEREVDDEKKTLVFVDQATGAPMSTTIGALQRNILSGALVVVTGETASLSAGKESPVPLITTLEDLPEKYRTEVDKRHSYVLHMRRQGITRGQRRAIAQALKKLAGRLPVSNATGEAPADPTPPRESAVMEWMRKSDISGGSIAALLTGDARRKRSPRQHPLIRALARDFVPKHYCTRKRPSIADTKLLLERKIAPLVAAGQVPAEKASISLSTVRRIIEDIDPFERDVARYGSAYTRNKWRYSLKGITAAQPLARYEIDHTILDVVVIADHNGMPLGRPTITVVIDASSGYIAGFFISFWGTGLASTLAALKVAISPKEDYVAGGGLSNPWLAYGIPMLFVVDNGLEFHSPQFIAVAKHLDTDVRFCAVRQPWLKPFVERCLQTLLSYLPKAGRVEKPRDNYLPLNPDKTAAVTFSGLCKGLLKAFVDIHPFEINERKLVLPFDRFGEGMADLLPPALPTSTRELDIIVAQSKPLTVGNEGVVSAYLRYNSRELQALRRATSLNFKTTVKFNPEDLGHVYVQEPQSKGWLEVPSCMPDYTAGLSIVQHRAIRARLKGDLNRREIPQHLARAKLELIDMWNSISVKGKRLQQKELRAMSGLTSGHVIGGADTPVGDSAATPVVAPEEMVIPAFEIPQFESLRMGGFHA